MPRRAADGEVGDFLRLLGRLRWLSVIGQALTILVVQYAIGLDLPLWPLAAGVLALVIANLWLGRRPPATGLGPVLAHLGFDIGVLTWQLYWSGGPANPFVSLYIAPIAVVAAALPARAVHWTAVMAAVGYGLLWLDHRPLPHVHGEFDLHLFGMWVNFLLTAAVVAAFGSHAARALSAQRAALALARERSARDEGLMAVASLAAGAAHALNTPLSTMSVLLADLRTGCADADPAAREDLESVQRQVDSCRDAVRALVCEAQPDSSPATAQPLGARLEAALQRWRLLRPAFELALDLPADLAALPVRVGRALDYLLWNLLNNAADASLAAGERGIGLAVRRDGDHLLLTVSDRGRGLRAAPAPFRSSKPDGLGLGLALAEQTCERLGGSLDFSALPKPGGVRARLALAALGVAT